MSEIEDSIALFYGKRPTRSGSKIFARPQKSDSRVIKPVVTTKKRGHCGKKKRARQQKKVVGVEKS